VSVDVDGFADCAGLGFVAHNHRIETARPEETVVRGVEIFIGLVRDVQATSSLHGSMHNDGSNVADNARC